MQMKGTLRKPTSCLKYVWKSENLSNFSQPFVCIDLQIVLIKRNFPDSTSEYPPLARELIGLSSKSNLSQAFNALSVWSASPTKKWRPQKNH